MVYNRALKTMRRKLLLWVAVLLLANVALAQTHYDFSAVAPSGQTLYYKIVDGEAHVVKPYGSYTSSDNMEGDLSIPQSVNYNGTTYTVSAIGAGAFSYCSYITSVVIPNTVRIIDKDAFESCSGMNTVSIPSSVTKIRDEAFAYCRTLTSVVIPNSVDSLGERVFYQCDNLISAVIGNSVTAISRSAFSCCERLAAISIPASVTVIDGNAFWSCFALTSIDIPNSVTTIGDFAFYQCRNLASVVIPSSVTSIGGSAFGSCDNITSIAVAQGNAVYDSRNSCNALIETATNTLIKGCVNTVIPSTITSIGNSAFSGCSGLTSVNLPNGLTSIGSYAFYGCSGLTSIALPGSLTTINRSAFSHCSGLTSVTVPASVTDISPGYSWGENPFDFCNNLMSIVVEPGNTKYDSRGNCNAIIETATNTLLAGCKNTTIPGNVVIIGTGAFEGQTELRITIPASVSQINGYAFAYSGTIIVPNTVSAIGNNAFYLANNVVYSGTLEGAPWGAKTLNGYVENGLIFTDNSKTVMTGFEGNLGAVVIPASVDTIRKHALSYGNLTSVTIPRSVKWIGNCALNNCNRLQTVTLNADSCRYDSWHDNGIDMDMNIDLFSGCNNLRTIIIGGNVRYIPRYTIDYSTIDTIISHAEVPPAFWGCRRSEIVMKVPCTALDAYRNTEPWSRLDLYCETEGIEATRDEAYVVYGNEGKIVVEGAMQESVSVYDMMGRMVCQWQGDGARRVKQGLYLVRIGESSARKVVVM